MQVPVWLVLGVAALVIAFGGYRIQRAFRKPADESGQPINDDPTRPAKPGPSILGGGMYRMSPRAHFFIGIVYVLLGASLVATTFGWRPFL